MQHPEGGEVGHPRPLPVGFLLATAPTIPVITAMMDVTPPQIPRIPQIKAVTAAALVLIAGCNEYCGCPGMPGSPYPGGPTPGPPGGGFPKGFPGGFPCGGNGGNCDMLISLKQQC